MRKYIAIKQRLLTLDFRNHDANLERQRVYARQKREREKKLKLDDTARQEYTAWETIPFHGKVVMLVVWGARRRAYRSIPARGLDTAVDPRHGFTPTALSIYTMYLAAMRDSAALAPLAWPDLCEVIGRLADAGWLEFTGAGYLEDGQHVQDESQLLQLTHCAGFIRNRLLGGSGELGGVVRDMTLADFAMYDSLSSQRAHLM